MQYVTIPELPEYIGEILQDEALFEVCYWDGNEYISQRIPGSVIKNVISGGAQWGSITGILSNQQDLQEALNSKFDVPQGSFNQYINGEGFLETFPEIPAPQVNSDWNATSGVAEILNKPTIPAAQVNSDWNATSGIAEILNKPILALVATSGQYSDLQGLPTIPAAQVNSDWNATSGIAEILNKPILALVATSGQYSDLQGLPTIPAAQINSDWNATSGLAEILNKPTIPAAQVNSDWNATSGVAQILNKPTVFPPSGAAGGDLSNNYPNPTVSKIHGIDVQSGTPTNADVLQYNSTNNRWQHKQLTKADVGLSEVQNISPLNMPVSLATQNALDQKANLISPSFSGSPTAPTQPVGTNDNTIATTSFVQNAVGGGGGGNIPPVGGTELRRGITALNGTSSPISLLGVSSTQQGSLVAVTVTPTTSTPYPRFRICSTTGTLNNVVSSVISSGASFSNRGMGYRFTCLFSPTDVSTTGTELYASGAKQFYGVADSLTAVVINSSNAVESLLNVIGIGSDISSPNLCIFHNDNLGNCTVIDLGGSFQAGKTSAIPFTNAYYFELYTQGTNYDVYYKVVSLQNGVSTSGVLTSNLPQLSARAIPQAVRCSGLSSSNVSIDIGSLTISTLY